ncbi:Nup93/Nic96-domain-containing protein [Gaertneriomyces semiglobifer]|nr:Nup93/Nic96-domain-containing protein [Gaertneriomyces semiglobifer]
MDYRPGSLSELLEQSRQLTNHILPSGVAHVNRGLDQLDAQSKRIVAKSEQKLNATLPHGGVDARTASLLASRGLDPVKVRENLESIDGTQSFERLGALKDTDVEGYLNNEYENIVTVAINETKRDTEVSYRRTFDTLLQNDWDKARRRVLEELGHAEVPWGTQNKNEDGFIPATTALMGSFDALDQQRFFKGGLVAHPRMHAYTSVVMQLNQNRLAKQEFDLAKAYAEVTKREGANIKAFAMFSAVWRLLHLLFTSGRLSHPIFDGRAHSEEFRERVTRVSRTYLERTYRDWISNFVRSRHAVIGGTVSVNAEVKAMLELRLMKNGRWLRELEIIDRQPFWAHAFTLLRSGHVQDAVRYSAKFAHHQSASELHIYLKAWADNSGRLPKELRNRLLQEWNATLRDHELDGNVDPFKFAVYKIVGRCDLMTALRNPLVSNSGEDYVWSMLVLAQEKVLDTDPVQDRLTLRDISLRLQRFDPEHYKSAPMFFQLMCLCGEYELGIAHLLTDGEYAVEAIHYAVACAYHGVLRVPIRQSEITEGGLLLSGRATYPPDHPSHMARSLNFAHLIRHCARGLAKSNTRAALNYIYLLGLFVERGVMQWHLGESAKVSPYNCREYLSLGYSLVRDMVLESRNYESLLGTTPTAGPRVVGEIEQHQALLHIDTANEFHRLIVAEIAKQADKNGMFMDAVRIYHLSGHYDEAVDLLSRQLSESLIQHRYRETTGASILDENSAAADNATKMALETASYYESQPAIRTKISPVSQQTCLTLAHLVRAMDMFDREMYREGLAILQETHLIPVLADMDQIQHKAQEFRQLTEVVASVMPDILLEAIKALSQLYSRNKDGQELKEQARALTLYAGCLQYRISSDTVSRINQEYAKMG